MNQTTSLKRRLLPIGIALFGLVGMVVMIKTRPTVTAEPRVAPPTTVSFVRAIPAPATPRVTAYGEVVPVVRTTLTSEVAGSVTKIAPTFVSGGTFRKGELLYALDPSDYDMGVAAAKARLEKARIAFESEEIESRLDAEEREALGVTSDTPLTTRQRQRDMAKAELDAATADLTRAERDRNAADRRAPFAGRVERADIGVGQYVGRGASVGVIYSVEAMEIRLPVPDEALGTLSLPLDFMASPKTPGPAALFSTTFAGGERVWEGNIVRVEGSVDPKSRMVTLVGRVDDPYGLRSGAKPPLPMTPGMFVNATIDGAIIPDAVSLPATALREGDRLALVEDDNTLRLIDVHLLWRDVNRVAVASQGIVGSRIVVSPLDRAINGMQVKAVEK